MHPTPSMEHQVLASIQAIIQVRWQLGSTQNILVLHLLCCCEPLSLVTGWTDMVQDWVSRYCQHLKHFQHMEWVPHHATSLMCARVVLKYSRLCMFDHFSKGCWFRYLFRWSMRRHSMGTTHPGL